MVELAWDGFMAMPGSGAVVNVTLLTFSFLDLCYLVTPGWEALPTYVPRKRGCLDFCA